MKAKLPVLLIHHEQIICPDCLKVTASCACPDCIRPVRIVRCPACAYRLPKVA